MDGWREVGRELEIIAIIGAINFPALLPEGE